jgi:hypothetical protein
MIIEEIVLVRIRQSAIRPIYLLEVDGVVKTIFLSFLNAVPGEERLAEG